MYQFYVVVATYPTYKSGVAWVLSRVPAGRALRDGGRFAGRGAACSEERRRPDCHWWGSIALRIPGEVLPMSYAKPILIMVIHTWRILLSPPDTTN